MMAYLRESAKQGGDVVARMLGTGVMEDRDGGRLRDCAFANVCLPIRVLETGAEGEGRGGEVRKGEEEIQEEDVGTVVNYIQSTLVKEFGTFVSCFGYKGRVWARLSGMVYLEEEDWEWCGDVLGRVCERVVKGEWKVGEEGVREKLGKLDLDVEE